jgi:catechol 2,3-dioxygenase-like lactoylglutathione lyase family enzyme
MINAVGNLSSEHQELIKKTFLEFGQEIKFSSLDQLACPTVISFDSESSQLLTSRKIKFFNWDLLFSVLGPNDSVNDLRERLISRINILNSINGLKSRPFADEIHGSIRVKDLASSACFYTWLFGIEPKEWTHRYVTFFREGNKFNFVLVTSGETELHHDTLYHLGMGVSSKDKVIEFYKSALENGFHIEKLPRTTWRGTPLHELWLKDPDGTLIEIYSRLTNDELNGMPENMEPVFLA